jgi:hypothetical protein
LRGAVAVARRSRSKLEHEIPRFTLGTGSAIPKLNPKLEALNPKQILISKFKTQNRLGHLDFGHLILFSISDLGFRTLFSEIATLRSQ